MTKRIAILRRNGYGDLLCIAPLVACLEERYPEVSITLFVEERNKALVPYLFPQHHHIVIPSGNKYWQIAKTALRQKPFDLVLSPNPAPMKLNNVFLGLTRAPEKIAVTQGRPWHGQFIKTKRPFNHGGHQALRSLQVFDPTITTINPAWYPTIQTRPLPLNLPKPILFFSLVNNRPASQLTLERFASIANKIYRERPFSVALSCPSNLTFTHRLEMPAEAIATPSFDTFLSLLAGVDAVLTGDGGTCHLAAALQKPQVALYAVTSFERWRPLSDKATCLIDRDNVNNIDADAIEEALTRSLFPQEWVAAPATL